MKSLIKVMLILGSVFAATFIAGRLLGFLTAENVRLWLSWAQDVDPLWVVGLTVILLFADLFIAVPTLTITVLAGFFLGFPVGATSALTGVTLAAFTGYWISYRWGKRAIALLIKDQSEQKTLSEVFQTSGPVMIMLSRAAPIVPEVTACMAGATRMPFWRYCFYYAIGTLPYVLIASYAGSISSVESPQPAIIAVIALNVSLWGGWYLFRKKSTSMAKLRAKI